MHIKKHLSFSALRNILSDQFNQIADARQSGKAWFELQRGKHLESYRLLGNRYLVPMSMVFFLLNLLAFYAHQILDLTDCHYQRLRYEKFTSRKEFWNQLRCTLRILLFRNWEHMFEYLLGPPPLQPP